MFRLPDVIEVVPGKTVEEVIRAVFEARGCAKPTVTPLHGKYAIEGEVSYGKGLIIDRFMGVVSLEALLN